MVGTVGKRACVLYPPQTASDSMGRRLNACQSSIVDGAIGKSD
jgi:hypothetical protein